MSLIIKKNTTFKIPRTGSGASNGIVVATTNAVNISGDNNVVPDGTYTKVTSNSIRVAGSAISDKMFINTGLVYLKQAGFTDGSYAVIPYYPFVPYGYILISPNTTFTATYFEPLTPESYWRMGVVYGDQGDESANFIFFNGLVNNNPSTDQSIIPTSGWDNAITITAV
jgi:hypothetical protein